MGPGVRRDDEGGADDAAFTSMCAAVLPALEVGLAGLVRALVLLRQTLPRLLGLLGVFPVALVAGIVGRSFLAHGGLLFETAMPPARRGSANSLDGIFSPPLSAIEPTRPTGLRQMRAVGVGGCHVELSRRHLLAGGVAAVPPRVRERARFPAAADARRRDPGPRRAQYPGLRRQRRTRPGRTRHRRAPHSEGRRLTSPGSAGAPAKLSRTGRCGWLSSPVRTPAHRFCRSGPSRLADGIRGNSAFAPSADGHPRSEMAARPDVAGR